MYYIYISNSIVDNQYTIHVVMYIIYAQYLRRGHSDPLLHKNKLLINHRSRSERGDSIESMGDNYKITHHHCVQYQFYGRHSLDLLQISQICLSLTSSGSFHFDEAYYHKNFQFLLPNDMSKEFHLSPNYVFHQGSVYFSST